MTFSFLRLVCIVGGCLVLLRADALLAQTVDRSQMSGRELYASACAACHGADGRGQPRATVGFETPLPDFTRCSFTTPEADLDWSSVVHKGGRIRALDHRMPSFEAALSDAEIDRLIDHLRTFCEEPRWPRGDLNFPRAFFTEKAFPENEAVLTTTVTNGPGLVQNEFLYEHRIGRRAQYEVNVPFAVQQADSGAWARGLGDVNVAFKYAFFDNLRHGVIAAAGGEVTLPTGKQPEGLGGGVTVLEAFGMFDAALPSDGFLQFHAGFESPTDTTETPRETYWRTAIGKTYTINRWGRSWSPILEVLGAKELGGGTASEWDMVPQLQVSLSGLQHVLLGVGLRVPVNQRTDRGSALVTYLLWDWFDGGLFSNWK